ncbi:hypothetical protein CP532_0047 [Ophiocordyceps camponoti-leonardi (nom. inval.)]|nr:hypothetical protein CP532_0047 [Ophiocordyceps camponoti-leonardi (nom. inval.)]
MLIEIMPPSSSTSSSSAAAGKQPTYTTAGTIYNPNTALPLQPPARRGRANRFQAGNSHSDLSLLPKSMLLPGHFSSSPRMGSSSKLTPQYTPLQQNYHRAVSPINDSGHVAVNMALCLPRALPEKGSGTLSFLNDKDDGDKANDAEQQSAAESDKQDQLHMQSLKKMPIKSVNNLASYPNPTQRAARMALREGGGGGGGAGGAAVSSFLPGDDMPLGLLRPADAMDTDYAGPPPRLLPTARDADSPTSTSTTTATTTLANGPGAPMPLTAGPPGQRQYRPSTFESTFRALQPRGLQQPGRPQSGGPQHDNSREETGASYGRLADLVAASEPDPEPYRCFPPRGCGGAAWARNRTGRYTAGSSRFAAADDGVGLDAREERIEEAWYAGTKYMGMTMEEILTESASRRGQHPYGAIGDGRPRKTRTEYAHIDSEKARSTPVTEDAAALMRCVFATLVRQDDDRVLGSPFAQRYERQPRGTEAAEEEGSRSTAAATDPTAAAAAEDDED